MTHSVLGEYAKAQLQKFVPEIDKHLVEVWDRESLHYFGFNETQKGIAREMITHARSHNLAPSKRIRSAFVFNSFQLSGQTEQASLWQVAAAIELVHTALLIHDDFMDQDLMRRGFETTNSYYAKKYGEHYGDAMAVNVGDMVLSLGYETFMRSGFEPRLLVEAMAHLQRTIFNTVIGQAHDVTLGYIDNWSEEDVLSVHIAKTGYYTYENPLIVGALLAGLQPEVLEILRRYAADGGIAFQLQDDILGVFGDPDKTGKSADSDLLQGKATLLVHRVLSQGSEQQKAAVLQVWGKKQATANDLEAAKQAIVESGSLAYNKQKAVELASKAAETAAELRAFPLKTEAIDFIQGVAEYMVDREV